MSRFHALLQHQGPLKHVSHAHRVATKLEPNVAPTGAPQYGSMMQPERTDEEERDALVRHLEILNQEIEYILATGRAYEALNAQYDRIVANNGHAMSNELADKWMYHRNEIARLAANLEPARMQKAKVEAQLSRFFQGGPLPQPDAWRPLSAK